MSWADRSALAALREHAVSIVGPDRVATDATHRLLHGYDASMEVGSADLVAAPSNRDQLAALVAAAYQHGVAFVPRGAGTGYSGGALPAHGGMVILTRDLNRILDEDFDVGWIRCEPGVTLARIHERAAAAGWRYVPDPSSHQVCTIGGNIAENAGGPHALGGGSTANHVISVELIGPDGSVAILDEHDVYDGNLDLVALIVGSEATLGVVAAVTLRLLPTSPSQHAVIARFDDPQAAVAAVMNVFDAGMLPSAMDMLTGAYIPGRTDHTDPSLLFVHLQGQPEEVDTGLQILQTCIEATGGDYSRFRAAEYLGRRAELVKGKVRRMVADSGHPRYYLFDATAPRSRLPELMNAITEAADHFGLPVLNTFHAGDGNVHPTPFFTPGPGMEEVLAAFSTRILRDCAALGGALSGEHGIGSEKRDLMSEFYTPAALEAMHTIKAVFDPRGLSNPGKLLPPRQPEDHHPQTVTDVLPLHPGQVHRIDAYLDIGPHTTFADAEKLLANSPYELTYEPLGGHPDEPILAAIDTARPGLREPHPFRARDLIIAAELDGELFGGAVTKDVAGYPLRALAFGNRGRARLTGARLRLLPAVTDACSVVVPTRSVTDALAVLTRLRAAALPFAHLGILVGTDGAVQLVGRLEVRGHTVARAVATLSELAPTTQAKTQPIWADPPMFAFAGADITGRRIHRWADLDLVLRTDSTTPQYLSIGQRRLWTTAPSTATTTPLSRALSEALHTPCGRP